MKPKKVKSQKAKKNNMPDKKTKFWGSVYSKDEQAFFLSGQHATKAIIDKFADDQLDFFNNNPNAYFIEKYRLLRGVPERTYHKWLERNEYLKGMHAFCLEIVCINRKEKIAIYDPKFLTQTLHLYSLRYDEANKYKAGLKNLESEAKTQPIKVVFEDYRLKKIEENDD